MFGMYYSPAIVREDNMITTITTGTYIFGILSVASRSTRIGGFTTSSPVFGVQARTCRRTSAAGHLSPVSRAG